MMTELSVKLAVLAAKDASEKLLDVSLSAASDTSQSVSRPPSQHPLWVCVRIGAGWKGWGEGGGARPEGGHVPVMLQRKCAQTQQHKKQWCHHLSPAFTQRRWGVSTQVQTGSGSPGSCSRSCSVPLRQTPTDEREKEGGGANWGIIVERESGTKSGS